MNGTAANRDDGASLVLTLLVIVMLAALGRGLITLADTEAALLRSLAAYARGRSVVVATHSPTVIAWADRCLLLPEGRLVEPAQAVRA